MLRSKTFHVCEMRVRAGCGLLEICSQEFWRLKNRCRRRILAACDCITRRSRLVEYRAEWPALFVREASRVRATLGARVLMLEHVGSTSVPGLAAKPIIDMILAVADSADEPAYVPAMESAGYVLKIREPEWYQHRLFKGPDTTSIFTSIRSDAPR